MKVTECVMSNAWLSYSFPCRDYVNYAYDMLLSYNGSLGL